MEEPQEQARKVLQFIVILDNNSDEMAIVRAILQMRGVKQVKLVGDNYDR